MKTKLLFYIMIVAVGLIGLVGMIGCGKANAIEDKLNLAEKLMEERADSAFDILNGIDGNSLRGNRIKARYALLKSMALDKNYIDTITFDVLQPAIDYYLKNGNATEKLRTYYYMGRIHSNAGDDDSAMRAYISGLESSEEVTDSFTLARLLVAQGSLLYKQYRIQEQVENNLRAAALYASLGKNNLQFRCYLRSLNGEVIQGNRDRADSILSLCQAFIRNNSTLELDDGALRSFLMYAVVFGEEEDIKSRIRAIEGIGKTDGMEMNLARAYSKIGEPEKGLQYLKAVKIASDDILDSLTYWVVKVGVLEEMGADKEALESFRNYNSLLEIYHNQLFSNELLFSEKKHEMELENMARLRKRDNAIKWILVGIIVLVLVTLLVYYRYRINKAGRLLAESNAEKFRLEGDNQRLRAENLASEGERLRRKGKELMQERDRLQAETEKLQKKGEELRADSALIGQDREKLREKAENLLKDRQRLESEMEGLRSEAENLHHKIEEMEGEQTRLKELLDSQETLSEEARQLIRERIGLLNGLIAQALTEQESYGKEFKSYIAKIKKDRNGFQESLVKMFGTTHPDFMAYLRAHGLTERELRYACLYAMGMRGKEIGTYLDLARHYNISTEVRRKLGLDPNDRNLGPFLRNHLTKLK